MRSSSILGASVLVGLASAAPRPQDIDFDLAYALPNPTYTTATGASAQIVTYNPTTVFSAAISQITASATNTALDTTTTASADIAKRSACASQVSGYAPVASPDTVPSFLALPAISSAAVSAAVPSGYSQTFSNLQAANNAYGYMGYMNMKTYDSQACANKCNTINGCISINIYFERDATMQPGAGCDNPPSTTNIKCVFWGGPVGPDNALNPGQWQDQFQVAIAGSNGYVNNSVAAVPGYAPAQYLGNAAINAPYDQYGFDSYMGDAIFVGAFDAELCAQACTQKSNYALAHPPTDGTPIQTCQFFNTYILYINSTKNIQGQYCAMYSESWPSSYATNVGQYRGSDHFMLEYSFSYSNATNPGSAAPLPAVYQAKRDILWPANSAAPYCSSLLGYTTPVVTSVATSTATVTDSVSTVLTTVATTTVTSTSYVFTNAKRTAASGPVTTDSAGLLVKVGASATVAGRSASSTIPEPSVLSKYPASIVSSACALAIPTGVTSASTTLTTTTVTSLVTGTTTVSATATALASTTDTENIPCGQSIDLPYEGQDFYYAVQCNVAYSSGADQTVATIENTTYGNCAATCGGSNYCFAFGFNLVTGECNTYGFSNGGLTVVGVSSANMVLAYVTDTIAYSGPQGST